MRIRKALVLLVMVTLCFQGGQAALADPLSIDTLLKSAEKTNSGLTAAQIQEKIDETQVAIKKGAYLPSLDFDVVDTPGFPGSSSVMGVGGIMGSPFRAGVLSGFVAYGTIWDFGRTSASVRSASDATGAQKESTEISRGNVDEQALSLYFECARYRSQMANWEFIAEQARSVDREVQHFVFTGQRSVVDKYLALSQLEQATTDEDDYRNRLNLSETRLQILTGLQVTQVECSPVESFEDAGIGALSMSQENPLIGYQAQQVKASQDRKDEAKAQFMPKLQGFASVGAMESAHIIDKQDWGAGLALSFPIFEGFRTSNGLKAAEADEDRQQDLLDDTRYEVDLSNARYDQLIESSRARLEDLRSDYKVAEEGFVVARNRYFTMKGSLVDLREALRNVSSIRTDLIDTAARYWLARAEKAVFNGMRVKS